MPEDTSDRATAALVLVTGGVASGKSTLSRALALRLGGERLEADRVRGVLLHAAEPHASGPEALWRRDLSPSFEEEIYADLLRRADEALAHGRTVVLDGCFPRARQRAGAKALAARHGVPLLVVSCEVPAEALRARLAARDAATANGGWRALHDDLQAHFEPPVELADAERITVQTDGPTGPAVDAIVARLAPGVAVPDTAPRAHVDPTPRVVSFDCWSTLLAEEDWPWAHRLRVEALLDAATEAGAKVDRAQAEVAFDAGWARHQADWAQGLASGAREVAAHALAALDLDEPHPALEHLTRRFEEASHTARVVALEDAVALLAALGAQGIRRVLVCDTGLTPGRVVRRLLDRVGLLTHLDVLAFSDEVGAPKPDARPFEAALAPLGVAPEHAIHVGDLRRTDVAGARALGMRTVRIRARHDDRSELPDADFVVDSHAELAELLGVELAERG